MLGSFVMGLLAAAVSAGVTSKKPVTILPEQHCWQGCPELHVGLRTGYCGSLTTFASWELDLIVPLIGGTVSSLSNLVSTICSFHMCHWAHTTLHVPLAAVCIWEACFCRCNHRIHSHCS